MGEAIRRQMNKGSHSPLFPDDLKRDIAASVRSVEMETVSVAGGTQRVGDCLFRMFSGAQLMGMLGVNCHLEPGGMIYRTGPDPYRDVVAFGADRHSHGAMIGNRLAGHLWCRLGDEVLDFSVGDWQRISTEFEERAIMPDAERALGAQHWEVKPPEYFWKHVSELRPTDAEQRAGLWIPELGKAWYMGWKGPQPPLRMWLANYKENMMPAMNTRFRLCIEHFKLRERVQAAREGKAIEPSPPRTLPKMTMFFAAA